MKTPWFLMGRHLVLVLLLALPGVGRAQFTWTNLNGAITITGYTGPGGAITIPATIDGVPVKSIGLSPAGIITPEEQALLIEAERQSLPGEPATTGSTVTSVTINNGILNINSGVFTGWTDLGSVNIPASVTNIGVNAFINCPNLTNLTVAAGNRFYSSIDGVLFDKQQKTLLVYPAGRTGSYSIPTTVTRLASFAIGTCPGLTALVIPQGVSDIASNAFGTCTNLSVITVATRNPDYRSVDGVLYNKSQTTLLLCPGAWTGNFKVPQGVTTIGMNAFSGCAGLTGISLPSSLISLGNNAFSACVGLTNVVIPDRVTSIGIGAFDGCQGLLAVTLGQRVTSLGADAFFGCGKLAAINLPDSLTSIGLAAFQLCYALEGITIPNGVTNLAASAFSDTGVTNVVVGSGVTVLEDEVFANDSSLTNVTLTGRVTSFGQGVFEECSGLKDFTIPSSLTNIGSSAFAGTSLTSITIPTNVISIGISPFGSPYYGPAIYGIQSPGIPFPGIPAPVNPNPILPPTILSPTVITNTVVAHLMIPHNLDSPSLQAINVAPGNRAYASVNGVLFTRDLTTLIEYPYGLSGSYVIPDGVTIIATNAFADASQLTGITIPGGVASIGDNAFEQCSELGSITVPDSVTNLANNVFAQCSGLTNAVIGQGVTSLGTELFQGCYSLTGVTLGGRVTSIGNSAFNGCQDLTNLTLPDGLRSIGVDAFLGAGLTNITIPASVTDIGLQAFSDGNNLMAITVALGNRDYSSSGGVLFDQYRTTLLQIPGAATGFYTVPSTVTAIGTEAFADCSAVTGIAIPAGVTNLGPGVFFTCSSLTNVFFAGNAPNANGGQFDESINTVTYEPGTSGWSNNFAGVPAAAFSAPTGALKMNIEPAGQILQWEASWQVDGGLSRQGSQTVTGLTAGPHTVSFNRVQGWTNPASQAVLVTANATNLVTGTYVQLPSPGYLQVLITPATAGGAGAQWRASGNGWQTSGATVSSLATNVTVAFNTLPNWTSPTGQTVALTAGQTNVLTVNYRYDLRPTLRVNDLAPSQAVSNTVFSVTGSAGDAAGVAGVWYQINGGGWLSAEGSTNWAATVDLNPGSNTFQAYAVDVSGNVSPTNTVTFRSIPTAILQVQVTGEGKVSPDYNNAELALGRNYQMTATAKRGSGFVFTNWTKLNIFNYVLYAMNEWGQPELVTNVSTIAPGPVATNGPTLAFTMSGPAIIFSNSAAMVSQSIGYQANFVDVEKPVLHITSPTPNEFATNFNFLVKGTASDNAAVASVWYQINGDGWSTANGTNLWSVPVGLNPGTNTIQAYAVDNSGNVSATNTVNFVYVFKSDLTVTINGQGTVSPNYNGQQLQVGENYTMTASPARGFAFVNWTTPQLLAPPIGTNIWTLSPWITFSGGGSGPGLLSPPITPVSVLTNQPTLTFTMASGLTLQANFIDIAPPMVTITTPKPNAFVTNFNFMVQGTANDNAAVASVWYQFNGGGWSTASGTNQWSVPVSLTPGTNTIQAYAVDTSGNVSATNTVNFVYVFKMPFFLTINGLGTVTPNYSGQQLQVGENYTITAIPAKGFAFTNWEAVSLIQPQQIEPTFKATLTLTPIIPSDPPFYLTNSPTLQFTMGGFLEYIANFVDIAPPVVTITAPKPNERVSNTVFTVTGTARDNVGVAGVYYQLNGTGWQSASTSNGYTNWFTPALPLLSATQNILQVYAVDTSGNVSPTTTVDFDNLQQDPAPDSLANTLATLSSTNGTVVTFGFWTNTYSSYGAPRRIGVSVGNYDYLKIKTDSAQLAYIPIAPPGCTNALGGGAYIRADSDSSTPADGTSGAVVVDMAFTADGIGTYSNETSGDVGTISLDRADNLVPNTLSREQLLLVNYLGVESTLFFGNNTLVFTNVYGGFGSTNLGNSNTEGELTSVPYFYQAYSPVAGLITFVDPNQSTNNLIIYYFDTNWGIYGTSSLDGESSMENFDSGVFALPTNPQEAPVSLAGLSAVVNYGQLLQGSISFGDNTYSQWGFDPAHGANVGNYTYKKLGRTQSQYLLTLTATAPAGATNELGSLILNFVAPNFCLFTNLQNQADPFAQNLVTINQIETAGFSPATPLTPTSLAGQTLYATNDNVYPGSSLNVTCNANGTFSQVGSPAPDNGTSSGTYTYKTYSPVGALLQLKYTSPEALAGATNLLQMNFFAPGQGAFITTFYDNSGDTPVTGSGPFNVQPSP